MAAENAGHRSRSGHAPPGFNEAAAHGRGKYRRAPRLMNDGFRRFNEAAAHGRGKCSVFLHSQLPFEGGSMRPRRMAAENQGGVVGYGGILDGSMRPRRMAAENS